MKSIIALALAMFFAIPSFAHISINPAFVQFGSVKVGGFAGSRSVYIQNLGKESVNVSVSGFCMDFQVSNMCMGNLYPNASCSLMIDYRPNQPGYDNCSLAVRDSEGDYRTISITGNATR